MGHHCALKLPRPHAPHHLRRLILKPIFNLSFKPLHQPEFPVIQLRRTSPVGLLQADIPLRPVQAAGRRNPGVGGGLNRPAAGLKLQQQAVVLVHAAAPPPDFRPHIHQGLIHQIRENLNGIHRQIIHGPAAQLRLKNPVIRRGVDPPGVVRNLNRADPPLCHPLPGLLHAGQEPGPHGLHQKHLFLPRKADRLLRLRQGHKHALLAQRRHPVPDALHHVLKMEIIGCRNIYRIRLLPLQHLLIIPIKPRYTVLPGEALRPFHALAGHDRHLCILQPPHGVAELGGDTARSHYSKPKHFPSCSAALRIASIRRQLRIVS